MNRQSGFTLIELMIAVVIVSILSVIALPAYNDYIKRSKIPDATSNLAGKRVQQEQFFQDNRTYVNGTGCNGGATDTTTSQYFNFSCTGVTTTTYTLTATGKASMAGFTFTVDQSNAKATTAVPAGWGTAPISCWVTNKGGAC
ncbi:MAG: type IV pilin protein [Rhodocyclaceae bacterium]|nr:type IV pilin protein [Rhodocyclaceae bacterium]